MFHGQFFFHCSIRTKKLHNIAFMNSNLDVTQTSSNLFRHVETSHFLDISLLYSNFFDFLFRSCNVVAFLLEKWLRRKKCRASVCSPVPTNVRRILTRRKLPTRGSTYIRTYHRTTAAAVARGGGSCAARTAWLREGCCLIHDGDFLKNFFDRLNTLIGNN